MSQYNFQGAIETISEQQLQFINKIILENGFENSKVTFEHVGKPGDNYQANVKRLIIEGENRKLQMIAKIATTDEMVRMMTQTSIAFKNEHIIYTEVFPIFDQLQRDAGIPESEHLRYAKCYGSQTEQPHEVILLEDLKVSQFEMLDRFKGLSNECIKSVLKNFAILHALSYVLKHKNIEAYNNFKENLVNNFDAMAGNPMMMMYFQSIENDTLTILEEPEHINCFKNKVMGALTQAAKLSKSDGESKYNVIQQGDAWTNNIMFRFEGEKLIDSVFIDYQQSKNNNPVSDLMYMIFNCTDYETRKQHFYDWVDYYHSELEKSLSNFDLKANYVYPRDKLDADFKRYGKLMFGMCVLMANVMLKKSEESQKMMDNLLSEAPSNEDLLKKAEQMSINASDDEVKTNYKNKIIGLIKSFNEFGLL